jgi:hypothetical protein
LSSDMSVETYQRGAVLDDSGRTNLAVGYAA